MKRILFGLLILTSIFLVACTTNKPVACTMEAKLCPDGSYVGRVGPDCEFAPCPAACNCPEGYRKEENSCTPECYYNEPPCLAPTIQCK